jgi:hypothetical protein
MRLLSNLILAISLILPTFQLSGAEINQDSLFKESNKLQVNLNAGFCDKYLWRGMTFDNGLLLQPEVVVTYKDFYVSSWGNVKMWDIATDTVHSEEIDFILGYYHSFESFDIEAYISYYNFFNAPEINTTEINLGIYYPLSDFTLFARSAIDLQINRGGVYGEIGVDYEKELTDKFTIFGTVMTSIGSKKFNEYYLTPFGYTENWKSSFNLAGCNLGVSYSPFDKFSIDADFTLNINIDKDVIKALGPTSNLIELVLRKEF